MDHKAIVINLLESLETERAEYLAGIVSTLDRDSRTEESSHLIYLVLKQCARDVPAYLPNHEFVDLLINFIDRHRHEIYKLIYHPKFTWDQNTLKPVTNSFTSLVVDRVLERDQSGEIPVEEPTMYCYRWPYKELDFPFANEDDSEELEELDWPKYAGGRAG